MDNVEEIKSKLDIVDVISEYVQLKPAGVNFKALCPFHQEKTPSFMVSSERQIWHCFGACGEGGDMFTFVMKIEGVDFAEALRILAKKAGVELQRSDPQLVSQRTKVLDILKLAADFYHKILIESSVGKEALNYLKGRGLSDETIKEFNLGYAPEGWDKLLNFLTGRGFKEGDILAAGLILKKQQGSGYYDRFMARIMFPLNDTHSNVVGFTGRILKDKEGAAKYVNTPETMVYSKSRVLYGVDKAKQEIRKNNLAVIVEGQMDVIASHQAGMKNVVASSGTALTLDQIKLLKRYTPNLVLGLDVDLAGQEATKRGIDTALQQEMNVKIITELKGKDPDECIQQDVKLWQKAIEQAKPVMEYYFESTLSSLDVSKLEDKKKAAKILIPAISKFANKIEQDYWLKELAQKLGTNEEAIRDTLKQIKRVREFPKVTAIVNKQEKDKATILGEKFLALILKFSKDWPGLLEKYFAPLNIEIFINPDLQDIARRLIIYYNNKSENKEEKFVFDFNDFIKPVKEKHLQEYANFLILLAEKEFANLEQDEIESELQKIVKQLKGEHLASQLKKIEADLKQAEKEGKKEEVDKITQELNKLTQELAKLI